MQLKPLANESLSYQEPREELHLAEWAMAEDIQRVASLRRTCRRDLRSATTSSRKVPPISTPATNRPGLSGCASCSPREIDPYVVHAEQDPFSTRPV